MKKESVDHHADYYFNQMIDDISYLKSISGEINVLCGDEINPDYAHDELGGVEHMPDVLVRVHSTEEISQIIF